MSQSHHCLQRSIMTPSASPPLLLISMKRLPVSETFEHKYMKDMANSMELLPIMMGSGSGPFPTCISLVFDQLTHSPRLVGSPLFENECQILNLIIKIFFHCVVIAKYVVRRLVTYIHHHQLHVWVWLFFFLCSWALLPYLTIAFQYLSLYVRSSFSKWHCQPIFFLYLPLVAYKMTVERLLAQLYLTSGYEVFQWICFFVCCTIYIRVSINVIHLKWKWFLKVNFFICSWLLSKNQSWYFPQNISFSKF